jgi:membrane protein CcdC involved in cytochrome C biogenesis
MQKIFKFLFFTSLVLIAIWIIAGLVFTCLPIEFTNFEVKNKYLFTRLYGFPFAVLITLVYPIKKQDEAKSISRKLTIAILLSTLSFLVLCFLTVQICGWINREVLFVSKKTRSTTIERRSHDCGIFDSSEQDTTFKIRRFAGIFIWAIKIDTSKLNKEDWVVEKNN